MRAVALSLFRVTVAVAILALAGAALIVQPVLGSHKFVGTERALPERLRADVTTLTTAFRPRSADHPQQLDATASYIERAFRDAGARVTSQTFVARKQTYRNEMIGYYSDRQTWPNWTFAALYPSRGDFVAVGGGWRDRRLARHVKRSLRGAGMRAWSFTGPRQTLDASDHRNYWRAGIPAVVVTDTAFLRNPNYHTRNDTAATLDYVRMARVVDGVYSAVTHTSH